MYLYHLAYTIQTLQENPPQNISQKIVCVRRDFHNKIVSIGGTKTVDTTFYIGNTSLIDDFVRIILRKFGDALRENDASHVCEIKYDICQVTEPNRRNNL